MWMWWSNIFIWPSPSCRSLHRQVDVRRDGTTGGAPFARVIGRHAAKLRGFPPLEADNARNGDADEIRLEDELIERGVGEMGGGVGVLARNRLEDVADIRPASVGPDLEEACGIRQEGERSQDRRLLALVTLEIELAHERDMPLNR